MNPTNEHREQAREMIAPWRDKLERVDSRLPSLLIAAISEQLATRDAAGREILTVLQGLAVRRHIDHKSWCWCEKRWDATKPHDENCAAARALWEKLQPENPGANVGE